QLARLTRAKNPGLPTSGAPRPRSRQAKSRVSSSQPQFFRRHDPAVPRPCPGHAQAMPRTMTHRGARMCVRPVRIGALVAYLSVKPETRGKAHADELSNHRNPHSARDFNMVYGFRSGIQVGLIAFFFAGALGCAGTATSGEEQVGAATSALDDDESAQR